MVERKRMDIIDAANVLEEESVKIKTVNDDRCIILPRVPPGEIWEIRFITVNTTLTTTGKTGSIGLMGNRQNRYLQRQTALYKHCPLVYNQLLWVGQGEQILCYIQDEHLTTNTVLSINGRRWKKQ